MSENTEFDPGNAVPAFLLLLGGALVAVGLEIPGIAEAENELTGGKLEVGGFIFLLGVAFFFAAYYWKSALKPWLGPKFAASIESIAFDFRYWVGFVLVVIIGSFVLIFFQTTGDHAAIAVQRKELAALRADFACLVKPRRLTSDQISKIASYLSKYEPHEVSFTLSSNDAEAGAFRSDIDTAIRKGGWKITGYDYVDTNTPCLGTIPLNGPLTQVGSFCLTPGAAVLCTQQSPSQPGSIALSCSRVAAVGDAPVSGAPTCTTSPCFAAMGPIGATISWQQSTWNNQLREGLTTSFIETRETAQATQDPKHPNALQLLEDAFRQADVQISGGQQGGGINVKKDSLAIIIGPRRRDGYGPGCPRMIMKAELVPAPPSD